MMKRAFEKRHSVSSINGGSLSQAFKAGLEGAAWGGVAGAAGGYIQGLKFGLESAKWIATCRALAYGVVGGAISLAQGGSVEAGFLSGFAGGMVGGYLKTNNLGYKMFAGAIVGGCASAVGGGKFESGAITGAFAALAASLANNMASNFNRASSYDDLKAKYGWKPGDSMIISKYRPLLGLKLQLTISLDGSLNLSHEHIIWLKPDGTWNNYGYNPDGLFREVTDFNQSLFGEMSRVPVGVNPLEAWKNSGQFLPTQDGGKLFGNTADGYGLLNYNCQISANWLHRQYP